MPQESICGAANAPRHWPDVYSANCPRSRQALSLPCTEPCTYARPRRSFLVTCCQNELCSGGLGNTRRGRRKWRAGQTLDAVVDRWQQQSRQADDRMRTNDIHVGNVSAVRRESRHSQELRNGLVYLALLLACQRLVSPAVAKWQTRRERFAETADCACYSRGRDYLQAPEIFLNVARTSAYSATLQNAATHVHARPRGLCQGLFFICARRITKIFSFCLHRISRIVTILTQYRAPFRGSRSANENRLQRGIAVSAQRAGPANPFKVKGRGPGKTQGRPDCQRCA